MNIKKIKKLGVISVLLASSLFATDTVPAPADIKTQVEPVKVVSEKPKFVANELTGEEMAALKAKFPNLLGQGLEITRSKKYGNVTQFEVEVNTPQGPVRFSSFVVDGVDYLFSGNGYDKDGKTLNLPVDFDKINEAVAFKIGNGDKQLYLFTEPECPYCQRLEANLDPEKMKAFTINVMPMPLSFHKEAKPMLYWVLSGKDDLEKSDRMHKVLTGDQTYKTFKADPADVAKFNDLFKKVEGIARQVGANGTPSVFSDTMEKVNYGFLLKQ